MDVRLYGIGCHKCETLKRKLEDNGISFTECNSEEEAVLNGIHKMPALRIHVEGFDPVVYPYEEAIEWARRYGKAW